MADYLILRDRAVSFRTAEPSGGGLVFTPASAEIARGPDIALDRADLPRKEVLDAARDPTVRGLARVMPTSVIQPAAAAAAAAGSDAWGLAAVGADTSGYTGNGASVAVLDTGIAANHPAFTGVNSLPANQMDFTGSGIGDRQGHGTHCAGTIFGRDVGGKRIGVARGVEEVFIGKVLGDQGQGDTHMLMKGLQWAVNSGARIVSMSLSFDFPGMVARSVADGLPPDLATSQALEAYRGNLRLFDKLVGMLNASTFGEGVIIVAASGNESQGDAKRIAAGLPAATEGVLAIGALGQGAQGLAVADFSNTFPQLVAPGVDVLSADVQGGLSLKSGTSMATPLVAGLAALWWEWSLTNPALGASRAAFVQAQLVSSSGSGKLRPGFNPADCGFGLPRAPQ